MEQLHCRVSNISYLEYMVIDTELKLVTLSAPKRGGLPRLWLREPEHFGRPQPRPSRQLTNNNTKHCRSTNSVMRQLLQRDAAAFSHHAIDTKTYIPVSIAMALSPCVLHGFDLNEPP